MGQTKFWYLSTNRLFHDLPEKDKMEIMPMLKETRIGKKEFVFSAGDKAETIYILKEGRIKISRFSEEGRELTIDMLDPGDFFGELVLAGEEERETCAEALEDSYICAISRKNFEDFVSKRPALSFKITKWIGGRLKRIENRFESMIFQDVHSRVMATLQDLGMKYGVPVQDGILITVKLSHQEIANLIGAARETVTLELNSLKDSGEILMEGRKFILPSKRTL
ncbi:MAG: Crp/Fnr family transcriptional regulator [Proteobacteria bacterium]|nr:Crp/Fnr family transcriptional regulator [Pseudomonadota bacterium]